MSLLSHSVFNTLGTVEQQQQHGSFNGIDTLCAFLLLLLSFIEQQNSSHVCCSSPTMSMLPANHCSHQPDAFFPVGCAAASLL